MNESISGFMLINKKTGPTSHDIVDKLRKITGIKKIGHAGTLDPFASGVLLMAIGRESTRKIEQFVKKDKTYVATLTLGATTDTLDREGIKEILKTPEIPKKEEIEKVLSSFLGEQEQIPPMFSAKKIGGKKLYELARKGIEIERKPSLIKINSIQLQDFEWPTLNIEVNCSSGTYIRSLAKDIGAKLGCGAYLEELERTAIDNFCIKNALNIESLNEKNWSEHLFQVTS